MYALLGKTFGPLSCDITSILFLLWEHYLNKFNHLNLNVVGYFKDGVVFRVVVCSQVGSVTSNIA
jgi:hypothetical protein